MEHTLQFRYVVYEYAPGNPFREGDWENHARRFVWQFERLEDADKLVKLICDLDVNFPSLVIEAKRV